MKKYVGILMFFMLSIMAFSFEIKDNKLYDYLGNDIDIKPYNRIVILDPSVVETFYMIGAEDKISAIGKGSRTKIYPIEKTEKLKNVGHMVKANVENILECNPDLVILNPMSTKIQGRLKNLHIPYIVNKANNFDEIIDNIKIYGILTENQEKANKLIFKTKENLKNLKQKIKENPLNLKGIIVYSTSPMMAFRDDSLPGQILDFLEIENIAKNITGAKPIISQEYILTQNPDFIVGTMTIKNASDISKDNLAIKQTKAYKYKNIFLVNSTKTMRGSPRIFEALNEFYDELSKRVWYNKNSK